MSFVQPRRSSARFGIGVGVAVVFHIVLVWALMNGLATKVVQVINSPIETKIVEEVKPPPPPPKPIEMPPPPKFTPPPPAYVPPPEVQLQAPPQQSTITTTSAEPPPPAPARTPEAPPAPAPAPPAPAPAPPAPAPAPAPPAPARVSAGVACSNYSTVMGEAAFPREATRIGLAEGGTLISFTLTADGEIKDVRVVRSTHAAFERASINVVRQFKCQGQGRDVQVQVPFAFRSE